MKGNLQWITSKFLPVRGSFILFLIRKRRKVEFTKEKFPHTNSNRVTQIIFKTPIQNNDLWGQIIIISQLRNYLITVASLILSIKNNREVKKQQEAEKHYRLSYFPFAAPVPDLIWEQTSLNMKTIPTCQSANDISEPFHSGQYKVWIH